MKSKTDKLFEESQRAAAYCYGKEPTLEYWRDVATNMRDFARKQETNITHLERTIERYAEQAADNQ